MNIRQCANCGKIFQSFGNSVCEDCAEEKDRAYIKVRDYIYAHPSADMVEIVDKTEIPEKWIMEFLREERLTLGTATGILLCDQCGKPITSGRLCAGCKERLANAISKAVPDNMKEHRRESDMFNPRSVARDGRTHVIVKKENEK
jgi:flagellar operon protein (TIGR03826 family)